MRLRRLSVLMLNTKRLELGALTTRFLGAQRFQLGALVIR